MDQCLRVAVCMLVLAGCFEGLPVRTTDINNLSNVKCDLNVTFTSPTDVQEPCYGAALSIIKDQLAPNPNCDNHHQFRKAKRTLDSFTEHSAPTNSSDCSWENQPRKQFPDFVKDVQKLVQELNRVRAG